MLLRPMIDGDGDAVLDVMRAAFSDLDARMNPAAAVESVDDADRTAPLVRIRHLIATDPGGAWVTVGEDGVVDGAALGIVREGVFGLSLLVVQPGRQSGGRGSALLRAALDHGADTHGGIILASEDPRALRAYWRAGYTLQPAMDARGPVRNPPSSPEAVRVGRWPEDRDLTDAAGRAVRGAAHGDDVEASMRSGAELLVHPGGGFALRMDETVRCVAATTEAVARDLLRAALSRVPGRKPARLDFIDGRQAWAFDVVLEAGLELHRGGAVAVRGEIGPMWPYIPSGAYL